MLFLLFFIGRTLSQQISMRDSYQNQWIIYDSSGYNNNFFWSTYQCCTPPNLNIIYANSSTDYQNNLTLNFQGYNEISISGSNFGKSYQVFSKDTIGEFQLINKCKDDQNLIDDQLNLSGMVKFVLTVQNTATLQNQTLIFHYWFICLYFPSDTFENKQKIDFDLSMVFIVIMACIFVGIFTKLYKIRSIKIQLPNPNNRPSLQRWIAAQPFASEEKYIYFQGFSVTWITYILYLIATLVFYLIVKFNKTTWYEIILIIVMIFSFFCCYFFLNEIQFFFSVNLRLQNYILKFIRVCDIISIILSGAIVTIYLVFDQPWYVSCLIAFCISGSLARLFKVVSLRGVTILYILIFIYDLAYYFGLLYVEKFNYQVEVLQYTNYPVLFELPQFHFNLNKICVWLSVTDVIVPGLSIAYLYRFGKNRNSKVYFYMGLSGLFFGIIVWALAAFSAASHSVQLSQSFIVLPIIVCSASLWGARQGDLRILWYGHFYDYYLTENFAMESTNEEIEKEFEITEKKAKDLLENLKQDFL